MHGSVKLGLAILAIIILVIVFTAFKKPTTTPTDNSNSNNNNNDNTNEPPPPPPASNTISAGVQNDLQQIVRQIKDDVDNNSCWYCTHNYSPYDDLYKYMSAGKTDEVRYADAYMRSLNHSWGLYKTINSVIGSYTTSALPATIKNGLVTIGLNY